MCACTSESVTIGLLLTLDSILGGKWIWENCIIVRLIALVITALIIYTYIITRMPWYISSSADRSFVVSLSA